MSSPLNSKLEKAVFDAIDESQGLSEFCLEKFEDEHTVERVTDWHHKKDQIAYPYIDVFCRSKNENSSEAVYLVSLKIFVKRPFNDDGTLSEKSLDIEVRDNLDELSSMVLNEIKDFLQIFGFDGNKRFDFESVFEALAEPDGQTDYLKVIELEIKLKKC